MMNMLTAWVSIDFYKMETHQNANRKLCGHHLVH